MCIGTNVGLVTVSYLPMGGETMLRLFYESNVGPAVASFPAPGKGLFPERCSFQDIDRLIYTKVPAVD
jgi:hypothetical protein